MKNLKAHVLILLLLAGMAMAYDPTETISPENASDQFVDSIVIGLHNAGGYVVVAALLFGFAFLIAFVAFFMHILSDRGGS